MSEPHLGASINACEELRWVPPAPPQRRRPAPPAGGARARGTGHRKRNLDPAEALGDFPEGLHGWPRLHSRPRWKVLPPPFRAEGLEGMQGVSTQSRGEKFQPAQSWPGAGPVCPLSPGVPFFPPFIHVSHLPFQGHSLLREALPGTPSSPLPWGCHLGPSAPRRQRPPPFCWQQLPPFYAFNTRTSLGVLHIVDHQQLWGWTLSHPCWGPILPLQPACCVPQDKSLPFSVLPSVTCEMEFGAPAPEGCLGT